MNDLVKTLPFLGSTRFWAVVLFAFAMLCKDYGWISAELAGFLQTVSGGHVGIRTTDRAFEQFNCVKKK